VTEQPRKLSEVMKEMAETLLRKPSADPSSEAAHAALLIANITWNECVGIDHARKGYLLALEEFEASRPTLWNECHSRDIDVMIDGLVLYKQANYPNDRRRILVCGMVESGNVHVEWLNPAAPGVDSKWEMRLFGLVRCGKRQEAIRFLQESRSMSRQQAAKRVAQIAVDLETK
jgi:hypothetical protein